MNSKLNIVQQFNNFINIDVWRIRANKLSKVKSFWLRQLRIILLAIRGFDEAKCSLQASALTFFSLLSVVPVVAMAFGIAKGFGLETILEKQIMEKMPGQEEVATQIIVFSRSFLQNAQGGIIAGIGVILLFWTIISVLGNIEKSFNDIWGVREQRSFRRKFSDYLSIMLICPFLLIISGSITIIITSQAALLIAKFSFLGVFGKYLLAFLNLLPYTIVWVLFTFIYLLMPNIKVNFKSALLGGIIGGTIYQIVQWFYMTFQVGVSTYGAIYGSFAALPLFLIWLQISWLILLFGAEISFAEQNVDTYEFEQDASKVSMSFKKMLALGITHFCVKCFIENKKPPTASEISEEMEIPIRLVRAIVFDLMTGHILSEVVLGQNKSVGYQPGQDINHLTIRKVIEDLEHNGVEDIPILHTKGLDKVNHLLGKMEQEVKSSSYNGLLKDI